MNSAEDWDPAPDERVWYRHAQTGDRGYLVRREGKDFVRYDYGPARERIERFIPDVWKTDQDARPLTLFQVGSVSWAADQMLIRFLGDYPDRKEWQALSDKERQRWMANGPKGRIRELVYRAICEALRQESA